MYIDILCIYTHIVENHIKTRERTTYIERKHVSLYSQDYENIQVVSRGRDEELLFTDHQWEVSYVV